MLLKLSNLINVSITKNLLKLNGGLNSMPKTEKEEPMEMAISWMSRINKVAVPNSKVKAKTEQETEVKRNV